MKIYKLKKDWSYCIGNGSIGFHIVYKKGDRFFEGELSAFGTPCYYPENGSYCVCERQPREWEYKKKKIKEEGFLFFDEYFELVGETDKPKEYFINKKYSQAEIDEMLLNK